jgi:hypothetical protein
MTCTRSRSLMDVANCRRHWLQLAKRDNRAARRAEREVAVMVENPALRRECGESCEVRSTVK